MISDCIADLHGHYPQLEGGDLLIVAGDLTARDTEDEHFEFFKWLHYQPYNKKIVIAGNHDNFIQEHEKEMKELHNSKSKITNIEYVCDSGTEFEGLKIWGSPGSLWFHGINPKCKAFTGSESDLEKKYKLIPDDIDILVTHGPPYGVLDQVYTDSKINKGSKSLLNKIEKITPKMVIFGHIHECGGKALDLSSCKFVNCSIVNERYQPVNKPVRVIL